VALERAEVDRAAVVIVALRAPLTAHLVVEEARRVNLRVPIVARTRHPREQHVL
jgi:voltage-gated potassium channel Kch